VKDDRTADQHTRELHDRFPSLADYPVIFTSALTGQRTWRAIDTALQVCDRRRTRIPTSELNSFLENLNAEFPPPSRRGRASRIYYCVQPRAEPPLILFFTSRPRDVPEHYRRFLERRLRAQFDFLGSPVHVVFRKK
jgi:GTP-binding protein